MIEIIPNWHPIFVHLTVGLFTASVGFYCLSYLTSHFKIVPKVFPIEFEVVARWCLWAVAVVTIMTILAGLYAFNTVNHDAISHVVMTNHRDWALCTATVIWLIAIWSLWRYYKQKTLTLTFIIALLIAQGLLTATAWRGAELVFRYGLGVMSLPQPESPGHEHHHHSEEMMENSMDHMNMPGMKNQEPTPPVDTKGSVTP